MTPVIQIILYNCTLIFEKLSDVRKEASRVLLQLLPRLREELYEVGLEVTSALVDDILGDDPIDHVDLDSQIKFL